MNISCNKELPSIRFKKVAIPIALLTLLLLPSACNSRTSRIISQPAAATSTPETRQTPNFLFKSTPTPEVSPQPMTPEDELTFLGEYLHLGYRKFEIRIWNEDQKPCVEKYIEENSKDFPDTDIKVTVSKDNSLSKEFDQNGRFVFWYNYPNPKACLNDNFPTSPMPQNSGLITG
jgi:hypothetical protein